MVTTSGVSPSELSTGVVSCRILRRGESRVVVEVSETTDRRQPGPSPDSPDVKGGHHGRGPGPSHRGRNAARRDSLSPYKVANFFFGIVITWIWIDPKHEIDLVTRDFHPLDQRPDEVPFARPIGGRQAV